MLPVVPRHRLPSRDLWTVLQDQDYGAWITCELLKR
jgi:hypothetical protein